MALASAFYLLYLVLCMRSSISYVKHIYWLTAGEEARLRRDLAARGIRLKSAKGVVCTPLDRINKISSVAPDVWDETCARQGSWYRASVKNGLYLVISSFELERFARQKAAVVRQVDFLPPRLAGLNEKREMVADRQFNAGIPPRWKQVTELEKRIFLRWAARLGSKNEDFDFLYLTQTANHSNFTKPRLYVEQDGKTVPYSIDRSAHLCSCCLELFQVIGEEHTRKLVAPCPGAVLFGRLEPDRYLLVEKP